VGFSLSLPSYSQVRPAGEQGACLPWLWSRAHEERRQHGKARARAAPAEASRPGVCASTMTPKTSVSASEQRETE
jgi:hypothetical protein